jgi:hypothetical protein
VQINSISINPPRGIVLAEDVIRGLLVIRVHLCGVLLSLLG